MPVSDVRNIDCMDFMKEFPDKFFDLAIVDPPYGIGEDGGNKNRRRKGEVPKIKHAKKNWDSATPHTLYFEELFRVSKNQIIWGANYFIDKIKKPSMGWIFWDKLIAGDFSDGELAYTSFNRALRKCSLHYMTEYNGNWHLKIHPTQKPISLYRWILDNYANTGDKILDTHMGSQSSRIAAHDMGFDYWGCEIDKDYFNQGNKRFHEHTLQQKLF